jgi:hypothetical protein
MRKADTEQGEVARQQRRQTAAAGRHVVRRHVCVSNQFLCVYEHRHPRCKKVLAAGHCFSKNKFVKRRSLS